MCQNSNQHSLIRLFRAIFSYLSGPHSHHMNFISSRSFRLSPSQLDTAYISFFNTADSAVRIFFGRQCNGQLVTGLFLYRLVTSGLPVGSFSTGMVKLIFPLVFLQYFIQKITLHLNKFSLSLKMYHNVVTLKITLPIFREERLNSSYFEGKNNANFHLRTTSHLFYPQTTGLYCLLHGKLYQQHSKFLP